VTEAVAQRVDFEKVEEHYSNKELIDTWKKWADKDQKKVKVRMIKDPEIEDSVNAWDIES
jgi:hypothetical protein